MAHALFARRQLFLSHYNRKTGMMLERVVSPQRLVHYRETWYIDAWCHLREVVRRFALGRAARGRTLDAPALEIEDDVLRNTFDSGYGCFPALPLKQAVLLSPRRAPWVGYETWHPEQRGEWEADGYYRLTLPYGDDREFIIDILKHGPEIEVQAPQLLRHLPAYPSFCLETIPQQTNDERNRSANRSRFPPFHESCRHPSLPRASCSRQPEPRRAIGRLRYSQVHPPRHSPRMAKPARERRT
jgi:hypothetical protein